MMWFNNANFLAFGCVLLNFFELGSPRLTDLISPSLDEQLRGIASPVRYQAGQLIHHRGDDKPGISIVRQGVVNVGNFGADGSIVATTQLGQGQCFGEFTLFTSLPRTHDIFSEGDSEVDQIAGPLFMELFAREPSLSQALLSVCLLRSHRLLEFLDDIRRLPRPASVAKGLLLACQYEGGEKNEIQVRQDDLANTFGVSRVSMGKILKQLETLGLIKRGYGTIKIPNLQVLDDWVKRQSTILTLSAKAK